MYFYLVGSIYECEKDEAKIEGIDLPELLHFARISPDLSAQELQSLTNASWPKLEALTLGAGFESELIADDFKTLLNGRNFKYLKRLSLRHFDDIDALILLMADSPLLAQLVELDFYQSNLTYNGAKILIDNRDKFSHLEKIGIRETTLNKEAEKELVSVFSSVEPCNPFREKGDIPYIDGIYQEIFWEENEEDDFLCL